MTKPKILIQLDSDPHASVFDAVVAVDSGVDKLLQYANVTPEQVRALVHGAMFTRGSKDLSNTAVFIGGSNVATGEALMKAASKSFFGPLRVSLMLDANGANTTAAAAVIAAQRHHALAGATAVVLASTGPVGQRIIRLLANAGTHVRAVSRDQARAQSVCDAVQARIPNAQLSAHAPTSAAELVDLLQGAPFVFAAGAAGIELVSAESLALARSVKVAVDLNAVSPLGIGGVDLMDKGVERNGVVCYGAIGVGGTKMKIHAAALRQLFESNDQVLDAEQIFAIGMALGT